MNIAQLQNYFLKLDAQISELIYKMDSLGDKNSEGRKNYDRFLNLEKIRIEKTKKLFTNNKECKNSDVMHDVILCNDGTKLPIGYEATVISCYNNSIMGYYNTIVYVTSKKHNYFLNVSTCEFIKIGTIFND